VLGGRGGYGCGFDGEMLLASCNQPNNRPKNSYAAALCSNVWAIFLRFSLMQSSIHLSLSLASTAALVLSSLPLAIRPAAAEEPKADTTEAADLGVMGVNLRDAVKFNWGFQGALQGAGTPNKMGVGGFYPLSVKNNSVFFIDSQVNYNFADFNNYTSLGEGASDKGGTVSTSTRLGYRWLNSDRSWMYGVNAGYDSRPTNLGFDTVLFQQVALNLEAVSNKWFASGYWLVPVGKYGVQKNLSNFSSTTNRDLNSVFPVDNLMVAGFDIGYNLTPNLKISAGYFYSEGAVGGLSDEGALGNGGSARAMIEYNIANGLTSGINITYDPAMHESWSTESLSISANIKYRFGANGYGAPSIRKLQPGWDLPVIQALSASPGNRDVLVHDFGGCWGDNYDSANGKWRGKFWSWNCKDGISIEFGQYQESPLSSARHGRWTQYKGSARHCQHDHSVCASPVRPADPPAGFGPPKLITPFSPWTIVFK